MPPPPGRNGVESGIDLDLFDLAGSFGDWQAVLPHPFDVEGDALDFYFFFGFSKESV